MITSEPALRTLNVSSAQRWNTPWAPDIPSPSAMSAVNRNGTRSGIGKSFPYVVIGIMEKRREADSIPDQMQFPGRYEQPHQNRCP